MTDRPRVVITGVGLATPIGNDLEAVRDSLTGARSGIRRMPEWIEEHQMQTGVAGLVDGVNFSDYPRRKVRTMGRVSLLAAYASERAVADAGLTEEELSSGRCGITYGSTHGSSSELEAYCRMLFVDNTLRGLAGSTFLKFMSHTCAANLAEFFGVRGRVQPTCSACTSASQAIGLAWEYLVQGHQDVMLCGGAEEMHFTHGGTFDVLYAASAGFNENPESTPRPFDARRDGVVVGEGAATLVLERRDRAVARGANIYGEILGYATSCDGIHLTNPSWEGMAGSMRSGLASADLSPDQIDYINAHGTATELGDIAESRAMMEVVGDRVPVSTQKSYTGHTLGACGAIESVFSLVMMRDGFVAANRTLETVDERCAPLDYVIGDARSSRPRVVMNNNFAFGGINTTLIIGAA
jgi:3-oxoacyl-[acyl-carrier-protein] synthase II